MSLTTGHAFPKGLVQLPQVPPRRPRERRSLLLRLHRSCPRSIRGCNVGRRGAHRDAIHVCACVRARAGRRRDRACVLRAVLAGRDCGRHWSAWTFCRDTSCSRRFLLAATTLTSPLYLGLPPPLHFTGLGATFAWLGRLRTNNVINPLPPLQLAVLDASVARKPPDSRLTGATAAHDHWSIIFLCFCFCFCFWLVTHLSLSDSRTTCIRWHILSPRKVSARHHGGPLLPMPDPCTCVGHPAG